MGSRDVVPVVGIVGGGRTRNGLGPFVASCFEAAGIRVAAVAGRDLASAERAAAALGVRLGHPVAAMPLDELAESVAAVAICSPVEHHEKALRAAFAVGAPCLCEKPFVPADRVEEGLALVRAFAARPLLLDENCQWPFTLPALYELYPGLEAEVRAGGARSVEMGLSPAGPGKSALVDALPHLLSFVQALAPLDATARLESVTQTDGRADAETNVVRFRIVTASAAIDAALHLRVCAEQPRPAWLAVNGRRADRRIGAGYAQVFAAPDGREVPVPDPLARLVYRFAALLRTPDLDASASLAAAIAVRLRLYAGVLAALG